MKLACHAIVPIAILTGLAVPAQSAELDYSMPSTFYDSMNAKLINSGYREVRVTDAENGRLIAYDPEGSEVLLKVDTDAGRVIESTYVHDSDG